MKCLQNPTQTLQVKTQIRKLTMTDEHKSELKDFLERKRVRKFEILLLLSPEEWQG